MHGLPKNSLHEQVLTESGHERKHQAHRPSPLNQVAKKHILNGARNAQAQSTEGQTQIMLHRSISQIN